MGPCNRRTCVICSVRRRRDWRWVLQQNLASLGDEKVLLVSITGPGSDLLPFDKKRCKLKDQHVCSGRVGCVVDEEAVYKWRRDLEQRWSKYTDACRLRVKRSYGGSGALLLAGAWEMQKRGVPHVHVVVPANVRGQLFVKSLNDMAGMYGFGFVDTKLEPRHVMVAAAYLSKYMTKYGQDAVSPLLPKREFWVSRELSIKTGATLRICRFVRSWWAYQNDFLPFSAVAFKWTADEHKFVLKYFKGVSKPTLESTLGDELREAGFVL